MLWYIMVCSMIGGISVSVTTGLGSAIVTTALGDNQVSLGRFISQASAHHAIREVQTLVYLLLNGICRCNTK